jgi:hypothetical protein
MHSFGDDENMTVRLKIWKSVTNYYCLKTDAIFADACVLQWVKRFEAGLQNFKNKRKV